MKDVESSDGAKNDEPKSTFEIKLFHHYKLVNAK